MTEPSKSNLRSCLWLGVSLLAMASMWNYVLSIWSAGQAPGFSDLYSSWWATHELLFHGRSPYTPAVAHEIQTAIYGAPVTPSADDPDAMAGGFAYPIYVVFWMWPTIWSGFATVRVVFAGILAALSVANLLFYFAAAGWPFRGRDFIVAISLLLGSFPVTQGIKLQNLSLLAGFLIAAALFFLVRGRLIWAGVLLAAATFKPQFVVLLIPSLGLWSLCDWRRRQRLLWGFVPAMAVILAGSELILPGWMRGFLHIAAAYRHYTYGHSVLDVWLTPGGGSVAAAALVIAIFTLCWKWRASLEQSSPFFVSFSLALAGTLVVIPTLEPHAQVLLLPGLVWLVWNHETVWNAGRPSRLLLASVWCLLAMEWAGALALVFISWLKPDDVAHWKLLPLYSSPLLPVGVCLTLGWLLIKQGAMGPTAALPRA